MRCVVSGWSLGVLLTGSVGMSPAPALPGAGVTEFECVIEPQQVVKLASPVVGVIARLDVDRGDVVRQGQIVGKIEDAVEAAALALSRARATNEYAVKSAEARVRFLRRKHGRMNELHTKSIGSLASLEEAEAEMQVAEQQLREAHLNRELASLDVAHAEEVLKQRTLRSPIDGVVVERLLVPGEYRNEQKSGAHSGADRSAAGRSLRANRVPWADPRRQRGRGEARTANRRCPRREESPSSTM